MASRKVLRDQLVRAWHATIVDAYLGRLINSERGLQVHFCGKLLSIFGCDPKYRTRRIFIEPHVNLRESGGRVIPDLLICNAKQIIGAVEIKYKPKAKASFKKDRNTLEALASPGAEAQVENYRFLGPRSPQPVFTMASDAVLCWAAVYSGEKEMELEFSPDLRDRFLSLHAVTKDGESPNVTPVLSVAKMPPNPSFHRTASGGR